MGCPTGCTMVDDIPVAVSFKRTWTLSTLVVLSDGRLYVNVAESFLTPLTTVFSSTGTVRRGGSTVLQKLKITLNLRDTKYLNL